MDSLWLLLRYKIQCYFFSEYVLVSVRKCGHFFIIAPKQWVILFIYLY